MCKYKDSEFMSTYTITSRIKRGKFYTSLTYEQCLLSKEHLISLISINHPRY